VRVSIARFSTSPRPDRGERSARLRAGRGQARCPARVRWVGVASFTALLFTACGSDGTAPPSLLDAGRDSSDGEAADAGSDSQDGASADAAPAATGFPAQAFEVVIDLLYPINQTGVPEAAFPRQLTVSMLLDEDAGRPRLRVGGQGILSTVTLAHGGGTGFSYQETSAAELDAHRTSLQIRVPHGAGCQSVGAINITNLTFDRIGDGRGGDTLLGLAMGFATYEDGDAVGTRRFSAELHGTPDRALTVAATASKDANPFDPVTFGFAEALATKSAELRGPTTTVPLHNQPAASPSSFSSFPHLLPFSQTLTFAAVPALMDLGGNSSSAALTVTTLPDPAAFVADGFESATTTAAVSAIVAGDVAVITSAQVPGISGGKALLIGPGVWIDARAESSGGRLTAKLAVPAGATRLRANFFFLSDAMGSLGAITIRLAPPDGEIVELQGPTETLETTASNVPRFPRRGPLTMFEAPLPARTRDVVYVDIQNVLRGCGALLPAGALVIDDLRVE
jgi:hypothetical protein